MPEKRRPRRVTKKPRPDETPEEIMAARRKYMPKLIEFLGNEPEPKKIRFRLK